MLVEFVSVVDAVRCVVDFSAVWASRRSPLVSLRAPDYPYFTSREAAVEAAAADWDGPVWAPTRLMKVAFFYAPTRPVQNPVAKRAITTIIATCMQPCTATTRT
jgi:hypothetical protein